MKKGELQINAAERTHHLSSLSREIATLVSEMTVDPTTNRPHTVGMIEKAMTEIGFSVKSERAAKGQALDLIRVLAQGDTLPIQRVRMRLRISMAAKDGKRLKEQILKDVDEVEEDNMEDGEWEAVSWIPSSL